MLRRSSRLLSNNGVMPRKERLVSVRPELRVTMGAPDHFFVNLYEDGKLVRSVGEVSLDNLGEDDLDEIGRVKPEAVWKMVNELADNLALTMNERPVVPDKFAILGSNYQEVGAQPPGWL